MTGTTPTTNTLCRYFASSGVCYFGDQCNFSHAFRPIEHGSTGATITPKNQRPCRNIILHGYCRFAGKGCEYNHDLSPKDETGDPDINFTKRPNEKAIELISSPILKGREDPQQILSPPKFQSHSSHQFDGSNDEKQSSTPNLSPTLSSTAPHSRPPTFFFNTDQSDWSDHAIFPPQNGPSISGSASGLGPSPNLSPNLSSDLSNPDLSNPDLSPNLSPNLTSTQAPDMASAPSSDLDLATPSQTPLQTHLPSPSPPPPPPSPSPSLSASAPPSAPPSLSLSPSPSPPLPASLSSLSSSPFSLPGHPPPHPHAHPHPHSHPHPHNHPHSLPPHPHPHAHAHPHPHAHTHGHAHPHPHIHNPAAPTSPSPSYSNPNSGGTPSGTGPHVSKSTSSPLMPYSYPPHPYNPYSDTNRDFGNTSTQYRYNYDTPQYNESYTNPPMLYPPNQAGRNAPDLPNEYYGKSAPSTYGNVPTKTTQMRGKDDIGRYSEPILGRDYRQLNASSNPYEPVHTTNAPQVPDGYYPTTSPAGAPYFQSGSQGGPNMFNSFLGLPHTANRSAKKSIQTFFMSETLRSELMKRNSSILAKTEPDDPRMKDFPSVIQKFHSLCFLDDASKPEKNSKFFGYSTTVLKGISCADGLPYCLRKIDGFFPTKDYYLAVVDIWRQIQHPNVITLRETFVSKELGEMNSLFLVYDFHPSSSTMESKYFASGVSQIPENVLWSFILQIATALRTIHSASLACRVLHPSKILVTGKNRVRINCVGILDITSPYEPGKTLHFQQEDLINLGKLTLSLATKTLTISMQNITKLLEFVSTHYSTDLKNFILFLLTKPNASYHTIDEVCSLLASKATREIEYLHHYTDLLESELSKEVENGRLFRILVKLGFINERPEFDLDPNWSETGDRYLLKLFRDYVFHQVYEDGSPSVDLGHIVECLNKLDAGVNEKILLMSRDEKSMLVVSYRDIKRCVENAFNELYEKYSQYNGKYGYEK